MLIIPKLLKSYSQLQTGGSWCQNQQALQKAILMNLSPFANTLLKELQLGKSNGHVSTAGCAAGTLWCAPPYCRSVLHVQQLDKDLLKHELWSHLVAISFPGKCVEDFLVICFSFFICSGVFWQSAYKATFFFFLYMFWILPF